MTNVITLTLQSSTFLFHVVVYYCHLLMVCVSPSWFDTQEHFAYANSTVAIQLQIITDPIGWIICSMTFVRMSLPYWLWQQIILYIWFQLRAHGGCDRSAEGAYSSMAPYPTFTFVEGLCGPTPYFVLSFLDYDYKWYIICFAILYFSRFCVPLLITETLYKNSWMGKKTRSGKCHVHV
jgi:hypothetical protein